jgi:hypothetical protein
MMSIRLRLKPAAQLLLAAVSVASCALYQRDARAAPADPEEIVGQLRELGKGPLFSYRKAELILLAARGHRTDALLAELKGMVKDAEDSPGLRFLALHALWEFGEPDDYVLKVLRDAVAAGDMHLASYAQAILARRPTKALIAELKPLGIPDTYRKGHPQYTYWFAEALKKSQSTDDQVSVLLSRMAYGLWDQGSLPESGPHLEGSVVWSRKEMEKLGEKKPREVAEAILKHRLPEKRYEYVRRYVPETVRRLLPEEPFESFQGEDRGYYKFIMTRENRIARGLPVEPLEPVPWPSEEAQPAPDESAGAPSGPEKGGPQADEPAPTAEKPAEDSQFSLWLLVLILAAGLLVALTAGIVLIRWILPARQPVQPSTAAKARIEGGRERSGTMQEGGATSEEADGSED